MKTLRRSTTSRVIGGVCGGIAEYFNIDPVLIRLIFVVMAIFGGAGIILYIIALIVMPERSANNNIQDAEPVVSRASTTEPKTSTTDLKDELNSVKKNLKDEWGNLEKEFGKFEKELEVKIKKHTYSSGWWTGIVLIFLGSAFLLREFGWLHFSWCGLWRYWPLILIFVGISCIPMKRWLKNILLILSLTGLLFAMVCNSHSGRCSKHHSDCCNRVVKKIVNVEVVKDGNRVCVEVDGDGDSEETGGE